MWSSKSSSEYKLVTDSVDMINIFCLQYYNMTHLKLINLINRVNIKKLEIKRKISFINMYITWSVHITHNVSNAH